MSIIFNVEGAIECVNAIKEYTQCRICDSAFGTRARYPCGHVACDSCVAKDPQCLLCVTPPHTTTAAPVLDSPSSQRAINANKLLETSQQAFKVDVSKRRKLSEQLKLEKEVFPQCIQAPFKYYNKRKSSSFNESKENIEPSFFLGERVSPLKTNKMDQSVNYVQKWLDNNHSASTPKRSRKPLSELNTNQRIPRRADKILEKVKESNKKSVHRNKHSPFKSAKTLVENQTVLNQYLKPVISDTEFTRIKKDFEENYANIKNNCDKDESGIVMDDEPIVIDDSQSLLVDKDELAWLAVLKANESDPHIPYQQVSVKHSEDVNKTDTLIQPTESHKVPFYKKSYLIEPCTFCIAEQELSNNKVIQTAGQPKDVSIIIESSSFTTKINMSSIKNRNFTKSTQQHTIQIQTDISHGSISEGKQPSEDLFTADVKSPQNDRQVETLLELVKFPNASQLVIVDSDSDDAANESSIIQVTADVHQSFEQEHGVLAELDHHEVRKRSKRSARGLTPNSSDSSDKENFDPNKAKRVKLLKKDSKKKNYDQFQLLPMFSLND